MLFFLIRFPERQSHLTPTGTRCSPEHSETGNLDGMTFTGNLHTSFFSFLPQNPHLTLNISGGSSLRHFLLTLKVLTCEYMGPYYALGVLVQNHLHFGKNILAEEIPLVQQLYNGNSS